MEIEINETNIEFLIRQLNLKEREMTSKRFSVQISNARPESISPFIFDNHNIGSYRCYVQEGYEVVKLIIYFGLLKNNRKLDVEIKIDEFGNRVAHDEVCYFIDQELKADRS